MCLVHRSMYTRQSWGLRKHLASQCKRLAVKKPGNTLLTLYSPELDVTPELMPIDTAFYQSLVSILRWIIELGRVNSAMEVSLMSSHLALPREGHIDKLY